MVDAPVALSCASSLHECWNMAGLLLDPRVIKYIGISSCGRLLLLLLLWTIV